MEIAPKSKSSDEVWNLLDFVLARILPSKKDNKKEKKKAKEVF
ncbi:hypothetical protein ASJ78_04769 [Serratia marcescens]|nr:hypothetical protein ASJ78_04769 [Serratia marcescens]